MSNSLHIYIYIYNILNDSVDGFRKKRNVNVDDGDGDFDADDDDNYGC